MRRAGALLIGLALLLFSCSTPSVDGERATDSGVDARDGRWRPLESDTSAVSGDLTEEQLAEMDRLRSIGYLTGSRPAGALTGVVVHDEARADEGLNLYTSGHFPGAILMDMDGNVLHSWHRSYSGIWPTDLEGAGTENADYWRHVYLFPNGDILAIFEGLGLVKLDKDSNVIWSHHGGEHHDLKVRSDGSIFALCRKAVLDTRISSEHMILDDSVVVLDPNGRVRKQVSVVSAVGNSRFLNLFQGMKAGGDILHTNAIEILDGSLAGVVPGLAQGRVLLSLRKLSALVAIDLDTGLATWALRGGWRKQHDPSVLPDGDILMFDNNGNAGKSRVVEVDPVSGDIDWSYTGDPPGTLYSQMCGAATRLPNGNTLITESDAGRAIEVAKNGDVVWEFRNPERAGENRELVATLFEVTRLPTDFPTEWLDD